MCGISGYIGKKSFSYKVIDATLHLMKNRGPDFSNYYKSNFSKYNIYLLHSRLSIIDLKPRSHQPFKLDNNIIIFNGEIYNYIELKQELKNKGIYTRTASDTEIILHYYNLYGEKCVNYFEGMWSFAIFNIKSKELFLSRDRFGEKPLIYLETDDGLYFGSEIKFIKNLYENKLEINRDRINQFLSFGYRSLFKDNKTYFKNVKFLGAGESILYKNGKNLKIKKYWKLKSKINKKINTIDAIEESRKLLINSLKLRTRADVPLSLCLSGGVDSSSILGISEKILGKNLKCYSIIDSDPRYNEKKNIKKILEQSNCKNKFLKINKSNFLGKLKELISYHDGPIVSLAQYLHWLLLKQIGVDGYKVVLSGAAADEIFSGYYEHHLLHLNYVKRKSNTNLFNENLKFWKKYFSSFVRNPNFKKHDLYIKNQKTRSHVYDGKDFISKFLTNPKKFKFRENNYSKDLFTNRRLNELFNETTPPILFNEDLNSMMNSVENRSPFLDSKLINFIFTVPPEILIQQGYSKFLLRSSMKDLVPDDVLFDRNKRGFNCSINSLIDFGNPEIKKKILKNSEIFDYVKKDKIMNLLNGSHKDNVSSKFLFNFLSTKIFLENNT